MISDTTWYVYSNLSIGRNGILEINNSTVILANSYQNQELLVIHNSGQLIMNNSVMRVNTSVTSNGIELYGSILVDNSVFSDCNIRSHAWSQLNVENSNLTRVFFSGNSVSNIFDSRIDNNGFGGVSFSRASGIQIKNTVFDLKNHSSSLGILITNSEKITLENLEVLNSNVAIQVKGSNSDLFLSNISVTNSASYDLKLYGVSGVSTSL